MGTAPPPPPACESGLCRSNLTEVELGPWHSRGGDSSSDMRRVAAAAFRLALPNTSLQLLISGYYYSVIQTKSNSRSSQAEVDLTLP